MTTYTIEAMVGGKYSGSGAKPGGLITTPGTNRYLLLVHFCARVLNTTTPDYHSISTCSLAGLTFTRRVDKDFTYTDSTLSPSFPYVYYHCDVFTAPAPAQLTASSFSTTMRTAADTFINDGWWVMFVINGVGDVDPNASNYVQSSHLTNSLDTPVSGPLTTSSSNPFVFLATMGHDCGSAGGSGADLSEPSGFAHTFSGASGDSKFIADNSGGSRISGNCCFQEFSSAQSAASYTFGNQNKDWFSCAIALYAGGAIAVPRSFGTIIT